MAEREVTRIVVGKFPVGIIGMKELLTEMSKSYAEKPDAEVGAFMLARLEKDNYVPGSARDEYARAFVREYRKNTGQPYNDSAPAGLDVKVLGAGCPECHNLSQVVMELLTELNLSAGFEYVTDIKEIARYGVMRSPALLINGKAVAVGRVPPRDKIKSWLIGAASPGGK